MLSSLQNSWVKHVRKLRQAKARRIHQQFLLEGTHLLQEALAVGYPLIAVHHTVRWCDRNSDLISALMDSCPRVEPVSPEVLAAMATTVNPDGVVAVAPHRQATPPAAPSLGIAVETLQDPGNLGTLIRTAAAAEADGIWLSQDSVDPESPKVLRASAGQWFRLPLQVSADLYQQLDQWRQQGIQVIGTQAQASTCYWDLDLHQPTVILMGNEGAGLSKQALAHVSRQVFIPQGAAVESLNVAISAALMLYEVRRQRR